jgi:hypothetical protein
MTKFIFVILFVLAGCTSIPAFVDTLNPGDSLAKAQNLTLVFGRIIQIEDGTEQNMFPPWFTYNTPALVLYRVEDMQRYYGATTADEHGNFYWLLPSGTYFITNYKFKGQYPIAPRAFFQVSQEQKGVYIGTLKIEFDTVMGFLFIGRARLGQARISVLDEYQQAQSALTSRYPQEQPTIATKLMTHDPMLPTIQ